MQCFKKQLTLGLGLKDEATFDNFYGEKNQVVVAALKKCVNGTGERIIYLAGARGQGCSHLLQAAVHEAHELGLTSVYLPLANLVSLSPDALLGLETLSLICLDDLHVLSAHPEWEEAVFHLYNRAHAADCMIVMAADDLPKHLKLQLPDLVSRLSWGILFQLQTLSDEEKLEALILRARRRGMSLSKEVAKYILSHCPRHMSTLLAALNALDSASLAEQRRLTIPFVKLVLEI